jgi:hypothetical protein
MASELEDEFFAVEGRGPDYTAAIEALEAAKTELQLRIDALRALQAARDGDGEARLPNRHERLPERKGPVSVREMAI